MVEPVEVGPVQIPELPYSSSWIDGLIRWISGLPGPSWVFYLLSTLALGLLITVVLWVDGSVPFGSYGSMQGIFPPFVFYFLALYHYLTRVGSRALRTFRPFLDVDESELVRIDYELATLPRGLGWIGIVIALATLPPYFSGGQAFGDRNPNTALPYVVAIAATTFFGATIFCLIFRSFRQLRMVHRLHAAATNINLLKLEPAHAFSGLTARTGGGLILLMILGYIYDPAAFYGAYNLAGYATIALPAVVTFFVPVMGMRDRLKEEKSRALGEASDLLEMTSDALEKKIRDQDYDDLQGMETAIRALIRRRELLDGISTWPWDTGTIRGFASTLLLPILLWLITRLLGKLI
ncbi:MAG: hypothetical protein WBR18_15460 [Anaerolineales bacterium]